MRDDLTELEIAWAAGLFEGEGCINAYQREYGAKVQGQLRLGSTDRDVVERFASVIAAATIYVRPPGTGGHKPVYEAVTQESENVRAILAAFMPYLGERRRAKALEVLERIAHVKPHYAKATHCPEGHAYAGDNLINEPIMRNGRAYVARRCRTCRNAQANQRNRVRKGVISDG